ALVDALEAVRAQLAEDFHDGLEDEDFARLPRAARLQMLRDELRAQSLDGFIAPRADEHQGEYVPRCGQRLAWLTGFTGSAGVERAGPSRKPVANPIDRIWPGRPPAPLAPVVPHPDRFAGESAPAKRSRLGRALAEGGAAAAVLTSPESIAWLLNIRGGDVPHTPLPLSFAILREDSSVTLFIDRRKLAPGLDRHLGNSVTIEAPDGLGPALDQLAAAGAPVQVDPATAASWVFDRLEQAGARILRAADPCLLPKACKNPVELDGTRAAH